MEGRRTFDARSKDAQTGAESLGKRRRWEVDQPRREPGAAFVGEAVFLQAAGRFVGDGLFNKPDCQQRPHDLVPELGAV